MSTTKFSKDNKIALAQLMQVQFKCSCSLSKIYKFLRHQNATGIMLLLDDNVHEKISWRVKIESVCKLFVIYTHVTILHLCYMRMYSFSTYQIHVIFSCTLLLLLHFFIHWSPQHMWLRLLNRPQNWKSPDEIV